ncbi:MAG: cysteine desulfurase family protein [Eubacteriales bacterium]|nr:cysteine desulfurase family protein [Eubacteriales bacterium]
MDFDSVFFDNASTTKIMPEIAEELVCFNNDYYFNPSALYYHLHRMGEQNKPTLENMRQSILKCLGGDNGKLIFTGSATEASNLAIFGSVKKNTRKILVSMGEHPSVYNSALELKNRGFDVEFVNLDKTGKVDIDDFEKKMTEDVDFVSIMHVSNETGAINDIARLVSIVKDVNPKAIFHCDGVQAFGKINVNVDDLGVDMYTISAHKIYGSKGVGALYVKNKVSLKPIIFGGGQESGLRSGTENLIGIYTLYRASQIVTKNLDENYNKILNLKNMFLQKLAKTNLKYELHSFEDNSPYIVSVSFEKCRAETLLNMLGDYDNIYVGNGSACSSKKMGNRVLESMGVSKSDIEGNLRISFGLYNTPEEVEYLVQKLSERVNMYLTNAR